MPTPDRFVPRFAAEPPQEDLPYGRWAERLRQEFLAACLELDTDGEDLGDPGEIVWFPDRTWHGRTYVPATCPTSGGFEIFGFVRFVPADGDREASEFHTVVDFTEETAARNPDWTLDLCDEVIGRWRGENGAIAAMTLVWGRPLIVGGDHAEADLGDVIVDRAAVVENRFTLLAPDDYRGDLLEIRMIDSKGNQLARESLYDPDAEE
jgi:hypothetical protein